jgi:hypothetical protein
MLSPTTLLHVVLDSSVHPIFYLIIPIIFGEGAAIFQAIFSNLLLLSSFYVKVFFSALTSQLHLSLPTSYFNVQYQFHTNTGQQENTNRNIPVVYVTQGSQTLSTEPVC